MMHFLVLNFLKFPTIRDLYTTYLKGKLQNYLVFFVASSTISNDSGEKTPVIKYLTELRIRVLTFSRKVTTILQAVNRMNHDFCSTSFVKYIP